MLIFLDIDGVMVTTPPWKRVEILDDNFSNFNQRASRNLQNIIFETNAAIVLTTSHKFKFSISQWKNIFKKRGINSKDIRRINSDSLKMSRKDEIINWLSKHDGDANYVIIDDDKSLNDLPNHIKQRCVITDSLIGLDDNKALEAIKILNHPNNQSAIKKASLIP